MSDRSNTMQGPIRMWLVVVEGGKPQRAVEVVGDRFTIGRDGACGLVLEDGRVSREHAAIVPGPPGRRLLYDLDSSNGTFVNGQPIHMPVGFKAGTERMAELWGDERLQFGDTMVVITTQDPQRFIGQQAQSPGGGGMEVTLPDAPVVGSAEPEGSPGR
jgi:pSer/pThr/pTyr-binding forkhead associated (FHA) protein